MGPEAIAALDAVEGVNTVWWPQPGPQTELLTCPCFEVFFGGARGGGKTDGMLGEWLLHAETYGADANGLMVRRQRTELVDTIRRSHRIYGQLTGWKWHEQDKTWISDRGAQLRFAYLERDTDAEAYQGHSYTRVYVEELGNFRSPDPVLKLMATLRSGAGVPCGFRATGNPGGPGQGWVRARYIDAGPWEVQRQPFLNPFTGETIIRDRVFIPSSVSDNRYLGNDYVANLMMQGSEQLVKAWLGGDWSAIEGAFFDEWDSAKHVLEPFAVPHDWLRFRSMDWGSAKPFSVGWWAVAGDDTRVDGHLIPRGALVRYREWYGCKDGQPNTGLKLTAEQVAEGIATREIGDKIAYGTLDPAAFAQDGGPSLAERMQAWRSADGKLKGPSFNLADNARVARAGAMGGWDQMRSRLRGDGETPMLFVFSTCRDFVRTVPMLQHDAARPEDLDTTAEDHVADEARYGCMSRPWVSTARAQPPGAGDRYDKNRRRVRDQQTRGSAWAT
jgi:hypothetical protein